ncbi:MAG: hypothetical protein Q4B63_04580 [Clostridium perfringens]|nr:hypothetical protein [Clostridium perfringens]
MESINFFEIEGYRDYKMLVENVQTLCLNKKPLIVIPKLSSKFEEEEITINIANTLALNSNKILVVDCNLRNINIYKQFNISNNFGLYEILKDNISAEDVIVNIEKNLDILTLGRKRLNLINLEISNGIKNLLLYLKVFYDYIILDMPETFLEYKHILEKIDGVILIGKKNS